MSAQASSCQHGVPSTHACTLCWQRTDDGSGPAPVAFWSSAVHLPKTDADAALHYIARARAAVEAVTGPHLSRADYVTLKLAGEHLRELDEIVRKAVAR